MDLRIVEALTRRDRLRGLLGRDDLPPGEALHLPRTRSVHTFGVLETRSTTNDKK
ncbi:MAG TPA: hypothetical protein VIL64_03550 [Solirubrobacteraceae bacterium]